MKFSAAIAVLINTLVIHMHSTLLHHTCTVLYVYSISTRPPLFHTFHHLHMHTRSCTCTHSLDTTVLPSAVFRTISMTSERTCGGRRESLVTMALFSVTHTHYTHTLRLFTLECIVLNTTIYTVICVLCVTIPHSPSLGTE